MGLHEHNPDLRLRFVIEDLNRIGVYMELLKRSSRVNKLSTLCSVHRSYDPNGDSIVIEIIKNKRDRVSNARLPAVF